MTASPAPEPTTARLHVRGIALDVRLGHRAPERATPQRVEVAVRIRFAGPPGAVESDRLEETVDYGALVDGMKEAVAGREFRMVERLGGVLYGVVRAAVPSEHAVEVRVRKVAPPVPEITGGAEFVLADG